MFTAPSSINKNGILVKAVRVNNFNCEMIAISKLRNHNNEGKHHSRQYYAFRPPENLPSR